jgi:signal transduction histidine kinase
MQLSFRLRLMIGYAGIVMLTVTVFGVVFYATVFGDLNSNLDSSMQRVASELDRVIQLKQRETGQPLRPARRTKSSIGRDALGERRNKKVITFIQSDYFAFLREQSRRRFVGPVLPPKEVKEDRDTSPQAAEQADAVWSAVYERILFDSKNYLIQIADTSGAVVWRSENLMNLNRALPLPSDGMLPSDVVPVRVSLPRVPLGNQALRLYLYRTATVQISIGYPINEIETTLADLFSKLMMTTPFVLLAALVGGWLLARYFVQPVEAITQTAQEITAHNLSQRIPVRQVNDEITRLAETLNAMITRLEDSFRQIRQFTGDASHELRTPLAILMGELEIALRSPKSNDEYQDVILSALEEVNRLSQVVQNLLDLSRADSGQVEIVREPVNISAMLDDIYEDAMILADEREQRVEFHAPEAARPLMLVGDKVRIHEAILNVVDNAIKYTPHGGRIMIMLEREHDSDTDDADRVLVAVSDTGVGIADDDLQHIFDRFYRVDKSRVRGSSASAGSSSNAGAAVDGGAVGVTSVGGHGLGLSIVKWIVEAHNGSIHVQSNVGKGTTFFLRFPVGAVAAQKADDSSSPDVSPSSSLTPP